MKNVAMLRLFRISCGLCNNHAAGDIAHERYYKITSLKVVEHYALIVRKNFPHSIMFAKFIQPYLYNLCTEIDPCRYMEAVNIASSLKLRVYGILIMKFNY